MTHKFCIFCYLLTDDKRIYGTVLLVDEKIIYRTKTIVLTKSSAKKDAKMRLGGRSRKTQRGRAKTKKMTRGWRAPEKRIGGGVK